MSIIEDLKNELGPLDEDQCYAARILEIYAKLLDQDRVQYARLLDESSRRQQEEEVCMEEQQ